MFTQNEKKRQFESLGESAQTNVSDLRKALFGRWPTPVVTADAKLDWDDDLAVLYVDFGWTVLDEAIRWHRLNSERRPSIPGIRDQCKMLREKQGKRTDDSDIEFTRHCAAVRRHLDDPNDREFTPVALIIRDTMELLRLKADAKAKGYTPKPGEIEEWKRWRDKETEDEWAAMRASGVKGLRMRPVESHDAFLQRRNVGSGVRVETGMSGMGEIASQGDFLLDKPRA